MMDQPKRVSPFALVGIIVVLLLILSLPVIAIATGALEDSPKYVLMNAVPERGDGAYLQVNDGTRSGVVKLYAWNFALIDFPEDAPIFNPTHISALIISQRGLDDATRYHLFRLDDDSEVQMEPHMAVTTISYTLAAPLADGEYMVDMPKSGLSSDRQYLYFRVDSTAERLPVP